jgi:hypothetical protein
MVARKSRALHPAHLQPSDVAEAATLAGACPLPGPRQRELIPEDYGAD